MIVVDTSVVAALYVQTPQTKRAEQALQRDPDWAAPLLWRSELRNVLATLGRTGRLDLPDAIDIAKAAEELIAGREFAVPSSAVLSAAVRSGCTAYDCEFVVLAADLGVPLVSLDRRLVKAFPDVSIALGDYVD